MELSENRKDYSIFNDCPEHSVIPSADYRFAKEFYPSSDSRYKLVETYKKLILNSKNAEVYNCKICIKSLAEDYYNVYVYFNDVKKVFGENYNPRNNKNDDLVDLFYQALRKYPLKELTTREMNGNGVFVQDFLVCSKSYAIDQAYRTLKAALEEKYIQIQGLTFWHTTIYIFFQDRAGIDFFLDKSNADELKQYTFSIIKPFDIEKVWTENTLSLMLDEYDNYNGYYFRSDAPYNAVPI